MAQNIVVTVAGEAREYTGVKAVELQKTGGGNTAFGEGGVPIEVAAAEAMNALLVSDNAGKVYKYIGISGTFINGYLYTIKQI